MEFVCSLYNSRVIYCSLQSWFRVNYTTVDIYQTAADGICFVIYILEIS